MRALGGGFTAPAPPPPPQAPQGGGGGGVWRGNWAQGLRESSGIQDSSQDTDATGYPVARVPWSKRFCAPRSNTLAPSWDSSSRNWAFDETASISKPLTKLGGWKTIQMRRFYHFGYFPNRVLFPEVSTGGWVSKLWGTDLQNGLESIGFQSSLAWKVVPASKRFG